MIVLADAGHVRDGLLYVIGGGIDQMFSPTLPGVLQATILARVILEPDDFEKEHTLKLTVRAESSDTVLAQMQGKFFTKRISVENPGFATAIKLDGLPLPEYGRYSMLLQVDDTALKEFRVTLAEPAALQRRSTDPARKASKNPTIRPKTKRRKS